MPRTLSPEAMGCIAAQLKLNPKALGPRLGRLALRYNIPPLAFAQLLRVSEPTVYRWFYGDSKPRAIYTTNIRRLISVFKLAAQAGDVPLEGTYRERMKQVAPIIQKYKEFVQ